jgi:hypothetical protein
MQIKQLFQVLEIKENQYTKCQSSVIGQSSYMFQISCVLGFCCSMFSLYGSTTSNMFSQAQLSSL